MERVHRSGQFILGPEVKAFEQEMAAMVGTEHAVACNSGTDALILALRAFGIEPGDQVITSSFSFVATAECVSIIGAEPVFVDIDPQTFNLDPAEVEAAITPRTKAIIPVHLFGHPADMDAIITIAGQHAIITIAGQHGLKVLEDAAQACGARYKDRPIGGLADAGAFSFFPSKNLGAFGDGGMQ